MADILDKVAELDTEVSATPKLMPLALYTAPDKAESGSPGFLDVLGRASEQTNLLTRGLIATYEASKDWPSDPNYNYWDHKDELRKDIPPQYWRDIAGANSLEEANHIKWRIQDEIDGQRQVAEAGYSGVAAQLVSGLLSPENIVPMGAAYSWADKGSRLSAAVKTGLVTGASVAAAEAAIVAGTYTKDAEDILYAATFGFTLGAGAGTVLHKSMNEAATSLRQEMDKSLVEDFDDAGAARNRDFGSTVETSSREDDIIDSAYEFVADKNIQKQLDESKTNTAAMKNKFIGSDYTRLINHNSAVVKKMAYDLLEGGTGAVKSRGKTAAQYKDVYERRILSKGLVQLNDNYALWAKDNNLSFMERNFHTKGYDTFYAEVRELLESRTTDRPVLLEGMPKKYHPAVEEAADRWDEMMEHALDIGKQSGVETLQTIPKRKGYVPLNWDGNKIKAAGRGRSQRLISKSYQSLGIDAEMADTIAGAVVKRALDQKAGVDADIAGLLDKNNRDQLAIQLTSMGLKGPEVSNILKRLDAREAEAGPSFTKNRTKIDLNYAEDFDGGSLRVSDLVDNDLNRIASVYARDISGRSALAKKGITSEAKWKALKSAALKDNANIKNGTDAAELSTHLDDVKSYFSAFPVAGGISPNSRRIQQSATLSSLGMVGVAQLAELGTIVGRVGLKAAAKHMPAINEVFTLAKSVKDSKDPVINELRAFIGDFDYDHLLYRPDIILDDRATGAVDSAPWVKTLDKGLGKASTALGYASGMNSIRHIEHQLAARTIVDKFANLAVNPKNIDKSLARMEDIGVEGKDLDRIIKSINKYAEFENGNLKNLNLAKWDDDLSETFTFAINKHIAQVVQRQLAGETSNWMHKTLGSLLTQFRTFPIVAYEKQLLRNAHYHDQAFYSTMLYGFGISYAIQAIRAGLNGDDMNSEATVKRAINYMGMASVAPDIATVAAQLGMAPEALNFRKLGHTGSYADEFDVIDHIPAAGQVNKIADLLALGPKTITGDATASDVRAGVMALPFATTIFSKSLMDELLED